MAKKKMRASRRAAPNPQSPTDTVTSEELAQALGVTVKTIRRWYQSYRLIPPPQIVRNPQSRGTRAVWPGWVVERGRRIKEIQASGLSLDDVRATIEREGTESYRSTVEASLGGPLDAARTLAARVVNSDHLSEIVRAHLAASLRPLAGGRMSIVENVATRYSRDEHFVRMLLFLQFTGFSPVCYVNPADLSIVLATNITSPWLLSRTATISRNEGSDDWSATAAVYAFNLASLVVRLGAALDDASLMQIADRESAFRPAPLVWLYMKDGGIAEYALAGNWRDSGITFQAPARRFISPADATLFRTPATEESSDRA